MINFACLQTFHKLLSEVFQVHNGSYVIGLVVAQVLLVPV